MKLKPAEEWVKEGYTIGGVTTQEKRNAIRAAFIRAIQADALRWAAQRAFDGIQGDRTIHSDLLEQANQLDPEPTKP